jgi:hypothetical protein
MGLIRRRPRRCFRRARARWLEPTLNESEDAPTARVWRRGILVTSLALNDDLAGPRIHPEALIGKCPHKVVLAMTACEHCADIRLPAKRDGRGDCARCVAETQVAPVAAVQNLNDRTEECEDYEGDGEQVYGCLAKDKSRLPCGYGCYQRVRCS